MTLRAAGEWNVALVGAATLQGREIKSILEERAFPRRRLALIDAEEAQGQLTDLDGEPAVVQPLDPDTFQDFDLVLFASSPSFTRQHWQSAAASGCRIIDLSGAVENVSNTTWSAPFIDHLWVESQDRDRHDAEGIAISPDPAAMAVAGILALLSRRTRVVRAAITIHEPVSERGQDGVEELHRQTISLLSFQDLPKAVFDVQVAFNMLSRYGAQSRPTLQHQRQRIVRHLEALRAGRAVRPAIQLLQAPVFHGYSLSCWIELDQPLPESELESALDQAPYSVRRDPDPQPDLIAVAGQNEFILGAVERDTASEAGYWIWGAFDHLRVAALNAVLVAEQMVREAACGSPEQLKPAAVRRDRV